MQLILQIPHVLYGLFLFFKGDINNVDRRKTAAESKREIAEKNNSVVAVGVCLSLVAGVALICVVVLRRSGSTW